MDVLLGEAKFKEPGDLLLQIYWSLWLREQANGQHPVGYSLVVPLLSNGPVVQFKEGFEFETHDFSRVVADDVREGFLPLRVCDEAVLEVNQLIVFLHDNDCRI